MLKALYFICRYYTLRRANCESPMRQQKPQITLQDGDIDHRQLIGIHSVSLHMKVKKGSTTGEKANVDTFVITEGNVAQRALCTVYGSVQFEGRLSPIPCSICISTDKNFRFFP